MTGAAREPEGFPKIITSVLDSDGGREAMLLMFRILAQEPLRDPAHAALCRWWDAWSGLCTEKPAGFVPWSRLYPSHRLAVTAALQSPEGFCRLVLEEGRALALDQPAHAFSWAEKALSTLAHSEATAPDWPPLQELKALGHGYLADGHRIAGRHHEAAETHQVAAKMLGTGPVNPEVRARLLELRSFLAHDTKDYPLALQLLEEAGSLLDTAALADLQMEVLVFKSRVLADMGQSETARGILRRCLSRLRPDQYPRLRLCAVHDLAAEEVGAGNLPGALKLLQEEEPLYAAVGEARILARRKWLLGLVHTGTGCFQEAFGDLMAAFAALSSQGSYREAIGVALAWCRLCVVSGATRVFRGLVERRPSLVDAAGWDGQLFSELTELKHLAAQRGFPTERLSAYIAELAGELEEVPN